MLSLIWLSYKLSRAGARLHPLNKLLLSRPSGTLSRAGRIRWYFALVNYSPTGIETVPAAPENIQEEKPYIQIPLGYTLVRRHSDIWFKYGFGDQELFPGYGKIYKRKFDVWCCDVGSREKENLSQFHDLATLTLAGGIRGEFENLKKNNAHFESLTNTQGYIELLSALDSKNRKRWYFGLVSTEPAFLFTAPRS